MRLSVDARPLDDPGVAAQGVGRYARGLLGELGPLALERGGSLVVLRNSNLRRPPLPAAAVELAEQLLLPLDLARLRPAVHHSLSIYGAPIASPARRVVTVHDVAPLQWPHLYLRTGLAHRLLYRAVRRAAAVISPSRAARADLLRHVDLDERRVVVVPEAAGERFRPADPAPARARLGLEGPYLLYVGRLDDPRKDVRGLADAFSSWARRHERRETLVLAGPGRLGRHDERVRAAGYVPDDELPALYSGASCFVTASRYEGFGLPLLEALACGTPVVAYEAGAAPETAGPGALLAPPGDAAALMRAVGRVCDEPELARRLATEGRRHAGGYSWRRTAELTWRVYERVA